MVQISGRYEHVRSENWIEYLRARGIPEEKLKEIDANRSHVWEVNVDGKNVVLKSTRGEENFTTTFILGEEVDEALPNHTTLKSTATLDNDTLTVKSKNPQNEVGTRIYKFGEDDLVITFANERADLPVANRFYKRV